MRFGLTPLVSIGWMAAALIVLGCDNLAADETPQGKQDDLELVITVDVSRPMDRDEAIVARDGYVEAFRSREVVQAITKGALGRIAVTFVEWSDPDVQTIVVPWMIIDSGASANDFANRLAQAPLQRLGRTSISGALTFSAKLIETSGINALRRVIDVSGNGPNNAGAPVVTARKAVVAEGITINGLPIDLGPREAVIQNLAEYYKECVIGGPEAFLYSVNEISQLPMAIRRKLIQEIATVEPDPSQIITLIQATPVDCLVGERLGGTAR